MLIRFSSICLKGHSLATAKLIQHAVLLNGQALLDAICDHTKLINTCYTVLYAADPT